MAKNKTKLATSAAAASLGRLGGLAKTPAQQKARAANGVLGGRPLRYQVETKGMRRLTLSIREGDEYRVARTLDSAAIVFLGRWLHQNVPEAHVTGLDGGDVRLGGL